MYHHGAPMLQSWLAVLAQSFVIRCDNFPKLFGRIDTISTHLKSILTSCTHGVGHSASFAIGNVRKVSKHMVLVRGIAFVRPSVWERAKRLFSSAETPSDDALASASSIEPPVNSCWQRVASLLSRELPSVWLLRRLGHGFRISS